MDYEKAYKEALQRADTLTEKYGGRDFAEYVFPELAESEDERIRKWILAKMQELAATSTLCSDEIKMADKAIDYLIKQKEQKPSINMDQLKSLMLQYLQEAANEKDDSDIEADTDKWARKILGYDFEQKPVKTVLSIVLKI